MDYVLARYDFSKVPSPSLCEAVQRALDALDPRMLLCVERTSYPAGSHVEVRGPLTDWRVAAVFSHFIKAMRASDTMREWHHRVSP